MPNNHAAKNTVVERSNRRRVRRADGPDIAVVEECDLGDALPELIAQTSYVADLTDPLRTIASHVEATGGIRRVIYREARTLRDALAPLFSETPWLDVEPNPEGQASLLAGLRAITAEAWQRAVAVALPVAELQPLGAAPATMAAFTDPRAFLLSVMNDPAVPMALRIDAAKALLPGA